MAATKPMKFAWLCAWTALVLASSAQPACAQSTPLDSAELTADERARELFLQGDRLYAEGSYLDAVEAFQRAYELSARPALLFNIANALERLGRYEGALQYLHRFAPEAPAHQRHIVLKRIQAIERLADARRPPPRGPAVQASPSTPSPAPRPASVLPPAAPADPLVNSPWQTTGYALVGAGTVAVTVGTVAAFSARRSHEQAQGACQSAEAGGLLCPETSRSALDAERSKALLADVGWMVGAAALGVGLYLVLDAPAGAGTSTHLSVSAASRGGKVDLVTHF